MQVNVKEFLEEAGETGEAREAETEKMREARVIRDQRRTKEE